MPTTPPDKCPACNKAMEVEGLIAPYPPTQVRPGVWECPHCKSYVGRAGVVKPLGPDGVYGFDHFAPADSGVASTVVQSAKSCCKAPPGMHSTACSNVNPLALAIDDPADTCDRTARVVLARLHRHKDAALLALCSRDQATWVMRDGANIRMMDMTTSHIMNCLRMMERNGRPSLSLSYKLLRRELECRDMEEHAPQSWS